MAILADSQTRVLVQGITGREAASFTLESIRSGTQIVAGVTPGKGGQQVHGVPVFDTVAEARESEGCTASAISVPAAHVKDAATEALQAGLKLLVILTERIPRRDVVSILERARRHRAVVIGPNSLGIVSPGLVRIGMGGGAVESLRRAYCRGPVGIMSRSGGMLTEIANLLTQAGIGQSTCISIGGDPIVGSTFLDLLRHYEADQQTKALVLFCEPGGSMEEKLAEYLTSPGSRLPIIAFVAGRFTDRMQGVRFGHAGAIVEGLRGSPAHKIASLRNAGVLVTENMSQIPQIVRRVLAEAN
jgi:succinyl-CoA synthetase alpha subunit